MTTDLHVHTTETAKSDIFKKNVTSNSKDDRILSKNIGTDFNHNLIPYWPNAFRFSFLHLLSLWGFWMILTGQAQWKTLLWTAVVLYAATEGVTIGAHRLYTHKSFRATPPLRALMVLLQTVAGQRSMYKWVRDHRLHHRYSDTDADPHNAKRGFLFSHIGWLFVRKHPMVTKMEKTIDMSDIEADWMVMFQKKYYMMLYCTFTILIPVMVPIYFWNENWLVSLMVAYVLRSVCSLNGAWLVNSWAHMYGTRPYDKSLQPVESWFVALITSGEGWHNYHHTYPWDYKASELGMHFNPSAMYIRWFEKLGLASDLKEVSQDQVNARIVRTGDGTHYDLGDDVSRAAVTAVGGVLVHPLNPTYTTAKEDPLVKLDAAGLPLTQEDELLRNSTQKLPLITPRRRNMGAADISM